MKCDRAQDLFSGYLENAIESPLRVALEQHLSECAECKASYERFRATTMLLDEMPQVAPLPGFHAAVLARVEQARRAAPRPVRWWNVDWQGVFNARVSVRAVAAAAAVLILVALVVQLTPLRSITAGFLWGPADKQVPPGQTITAPQGPLPWSADRRTQLRYTVADAGVSIGLAVDARSEQYLVYILRFAAASGGTVPLEVYLLPEGVSAATPRSAGVVTKVASACISGNAENAVPVIVTRSEAGGRPVVAQAVWSHDGRRHSEYVFLPPRFDPEVSHADFAIEGGTVRDVLSAVAAHYGVVVMASGGLEQRIPPLALDSVGPDSALRRALLQTNLHPRALASAVYAVESAR